MQLLLVVLALLTQSAQSGPINGPVMCYFGMNWYDAFHSFTVYGGQFQYWCDGRTGQANALGCIPGKGYSGFVPINTNAYIGLDTVYCYGTNGSIAMARNRTA